jgi:hypothetical protein
MGSDATQMVVSGYDPWLDGVSRVSKERGICKSSTVIKRFSIRHNKYLKNRGYLEDREWK